MGRLLTLACVASALLPRPVVRRLPSALRAAEVADAVDAKSAAVAVVCEAAYALRDGAQSGAMLAGAAKVLSLVSVKNNARRLSAAQFARAVEDHSAHYAPLLMFDALDATAFLTVARETGATVRTALRRGESSSGSAVWTLSRDTASERWLIDSVLVQPIVDEVVDLDDDDAAMLPSTAADAAEDDDDDDFSMASLTSPRWVVNHVLSAIRKVDEPTRNAGSETALAFCSEKNPSFKVSPEIFRTYLDDQDYPYGILQSWTEMEPDGDVIFDDDQQSASHDVILFDDKGGEHSVTLELSRSPTRGWLIDRVWING